MTINRMNPQLARKMEIRYSQQLRKIAGYVDTIVKGFDVNDPRSWPLIRASLNEYGNTLHFGLRMQLVESSLMLPCVMKRRG